MSLSVFLQIIHVQAGRDDDVAGVVKKAVAL